MNWPDSFACPARQPPWERLGIRINALVWPVLLFIFCLLMQTPRMFASVEICDTGHHLTRQQELVRYGSLQGSAAMTLLSDLFGGLWLQTIGRYGLLWVRLGGALLNSVNALLCYAILKPYHGARLTVILIGIACGVISALAPYSLFINYYSLPACGGTFIVFALAQAVRSYRASVKYAWFFIVGATSGIIPFTRMPMLLWTVVAGAGATISWWSARRKQKVETSRACAAVVAGIVVGVLGVCLCLLAAGMLTNFVESVRFAFDTGHLNDLVEYSPQVLLPRYGVRFVKALILGACWIGALFWLAGRAHLASWAYCGSVAVALLMFFPHTLGPQPAVWRLREVMLAVVLIYAILQVAQHPPSYRAYLLLCATIYGAILAIGSTFGLQPAVYGLWFPLPAAILSVKKSPRFGCLFGPICVSLVILAMMVASLPPGLSWRNTGSPAFLLKRVPYHTQQLAGLSDTPDTVRMLDTVIEEIGRSTTPGDFCLFYNHCALLYVLTGTRPCFTSPVLYHSRDGVIQAQMERVLSSGCLPKLCVLRDHVPNVAKQTVPDCQYLRQVLTEKVGYRAYREIYGYEFYKSAD
jgi:hypothetical protein